ncbi:hypothetical protein AF332_14985 [Sporosarcina globispora]|uniref:Uncharacterized protein n=1 Tax=Sporosarcina globispora TaxID=1459 RepID=A0A0M0GDT2_SPOGL|nr:hypothetical protein AF332_14985 [Sporosarcina globispora]
MFISYLLILLIFYKSAISRVAASLAYVSDFINGYEKTILKGLANPFVMTIFKDCNPRKNSRE